MVTWEDRKRPQTTNIQINDNLFYWDMYFINLHIYVQGENCVYDVLS